MATKCRWSKKAGREQWTLRDRFPLRAIVERVHVFRPGESRSTPFRVWVNLGSGFHEKRRRHRTASAARAAAVAYLDRRGRSECKKR